MEENKEITDRILNAIAEDSDRVGQRVFHGLLESVPINNLPERIFRDYFLPNFLGLTTVSNEMWMVEWVSVAGTAMSEVRIIDDVTGAELFLVPPILNTNNLVMGKAEGDIGDIFKRYDQISMNVPSGGLSFLITALNVKNQELLSTLDNGGVLDRWVSIAERYGYASRQPNTTQSVVQEKNLDDYFEL